MKLCLDGLNCGRQGGMGLRFIFPSSVFCPFVSYFHCYLLCWILSSLFIFGLVDVMFGGADGADSIGLPEAMISGGQVKLIFIYFISLCLISISSKISLPVLLWFFFSFSKLPR